MRITLIHNPRAGHGGHDRDMLLELLRSAGYDPAYRSTRDDGWEDALQDPGGLVVAAGGDGTVGKVGRELLGRGIAMTVIPVGTANNLSRELGIHGTAEEIVRAIPGFREVGFDLGMAHGSGGGGTFLEAAGVGLLPEVVHRAEASAERDGDPATAEEELERDLRLWHDVVREAEGIECRVLADGRDLSGRYLLAAAMNTGAFGPRLLLAPGADRSDGLLDLLLVRDEERAPLLARVEARLAGKPEPQPLPVHRVRAVRLEWRGAPYYLDDEEHPGGGSKKKADEGLATLYAGLHPGALRILVP
jgi:diacylglycerol kinase (ATP)